MGKCLAVESTAGLAQTNIALFVGDTQNFYRKYTTDVRILAGAEMNAGLLVNYMELGPGNNRYHVALLNLVNSTFGVYYYNGTTLIAVGVPAVVPTLLPGDWYRLRLTVRPPGTLATVMTLQARLQGITNPSILVDISTSVGMSLWNIDGYGAGLYSKRSRARFSYWHVDLVP